MRWFEGVDEANMFVSVITLGELRRGAVLMPEGARRARYEAVHRQLIEWFAERVFGVDREIALAWGELSARLRRGGRDLPLADQLLAATALTHDLIVVTRNIRHFEPTGCRLLCPWSG